MVSTHSKRSSAQARHTVESWPPERSTSAASAISATLVPFGRAGIRIVDDTTAGLGKCADLFHLGVGEREVEDRGILRQALHPAGARDHRDALLHQVTQRNLSGALAMVRADTGQRRMLAGAAAGDRAVS